MTIRRLTPVNARGQLVAAELGRMGRVVERQDRRATAGGVLLGQNAGGPLVLGRPPRKIWTAITGGANPYAHQQQKVFLEDDTLSVTDHDEGISGTTTDLPLWEINGNSAIPDGAVVRARLAWSNDHYLCNYCCTKPFTIVDDVPSGASGGSGSGIGGQPRDYFLPCCPSLPLPPILAITITGYGACLSSCLIGKSFPLYWNGNPVGSSGSGYQVAVIPGFYEGTAEDHPPQYPDPYGCLGASESIVIALGCASSSGPLVVSFQIIAGGGSPVQYTGSATISGAFCLPPFNVSGSAALVGAGGVPAFCTPLEFTITE